LLTACWIDGAAARAKVVVVGRTAEARARLACAGAVAITLRNIVDVVVREIVMSIGGLSDFQVVGDKEVVEERCPTWEV
jgi:hypothetical protein